MIPANLSSLANHLWQSTLTLSTAREVLLAVAGMAAIAAPVLIGSWRAPSGNAQSQEKLAFEVASIKRVDPAAAGRGAHSAGCPG